MKKNRIIAISFVVFFLLVSTLTYFFNREEKVLTNKLEVMVVGITEEETILMDSNDVIYTIDSSRISLGLGDSVVLEYTGIIDDDNLIDVEIVNYEVGTFEDDMLDEGIFSQYYKIASSKLSELTLDEKIGQLILGRYLDSGAIDDVKKYGLSGFVMFSEDFENKDRNEVIEMIDDIQDASRIPLIIAVDEEGGKVVRVSSNPKLSLKEFRSSSELYKLGGMDLIRKDTVDKSKLLSDLGINVNLAPVVDVSTAPGDYMYERSLKEDTEVTSLYAKTVINASKGLSVSYTLKHFPGYGNNIDTHNSVAVDNRSYESILENDIPPFEAGIEAGAEAVLVSHNVVTSIDSDNPASLSTNVHNLLRGDLGFTGVVITDDLWMGAITNVSDASVKAILSGNNLLITTDYVDSINQIKDAVNDGTISEQLIDKLAFRVLAWKYYKGLMIDEK